MLTIADENIPLARELFGRLGRVRTVHGRDINENLPGIEKAEVLAIRSVADITPSLVDAAQNVRVIGTATIGTDHIDMDYIEEANRTRARPITVFSAPGSNADSVADYIWLALCHLTRGGGVPFSEKSMGIIGVGNCGTRVADRAEGFGMKVLLNDPPREEQEANFRSDPLEEALQADIVTLHVPLTREDESKYPTYHMIASQQLEAMQGDATFMNACRGAVIKSGDLIDRLRGENGLAAVLDVYEGEPAPPEELVKLPPLATPHIAGYAMEAKRRGAAVIYRATCQALGVKTGPVEELLSGDFSPPSQELVEFDPSGGLDLAADNAVRELFARIHDITEISDSLKSTLDCDDRGAAFDQLRKEYGQGARHELSAYRVGLSDEMDSELREGIQRRLTGFDMEVVKEGANYVLRPS
mgnify:CR=1 FL=1